jgi:hypothetical protein
MKEGEEGKSLEKAESCLGKLTEEVKDPEGQSENARRSG